jgi:hypothetical protein
MSKSLLLMLCLLIGLLVLACTKSETNRNVAAPAATNSSAPATTPVSTTNSSASAGDKIGIEECDTFLTSYDNCVSTKVPEAVRARYKTIIQQWRTDWKKLADNPQTRGTLAGICKTQLETARTQFKSFGCTF